MMRRLAVAAAVLALTAGIGSVAWAAWSASPSGQAEAVALTMPAGGTPRAVDSGSSVQLAWPASTFASGASVEGYLVTRYDTATQTPHTPGAGCSGTVTTTSCTETSVPSGSWTYTVTPVQGGWHGAESPHSPTVVVP